jgi:hypothetical protein
MSRKRTKKPKDGSGPPSEGHDLPATVGRTGENLTVWLPKPLAEAVKAFVAQAVPRTSKTAVVEAALAAFLRERGFWPPSQTG